MLKSTSTLIGIALVLSLMASPAQSASKETKSTTKASATKKSPSKRSTTKAESSKNKTASAKKDDSPRGRLPRHYGKLGLEDAQRSEIYSIQAEYQQQLLDLQAQIEELKQKENQRIERVLTKSQRDMLTSVSKAKRKTKPISTKRTENPKSKR